MRVGLSRVATVLKLCHSSSTSRQHLISCQKSGSRKRSVIESPLFSHLLESRFWLPESACHLSETAKWVSGHPDGPTGPFYVVYNFPRGLESEAYGHRRRVAPSLQLGCGHEQWIILR